MYLYTGPTTGFIEDATQNRMGGLLKAGFFQHFGYQPPESEVRSWKNSLRAMATAVQDARLLDNGIVVEWQLPLTSKRIDCLVTGRDDEGGSQAVIVELKQWDDAEACDVPECVLVQRGGRLREALHPSAQVGGYREYLRDVHVPFHNGGIRLSACAYLHNFVHDEGSDLFDPRYTDLLGTFPLFAGNRARALGEYLSERVGSGSGFPILKTILEGEYRPHKKLLQHTAKMIRGEKTYVLLDEQRVVFNAVLAKIAHMRDTGQKGVFLVKGGPGTGKSVLALNLVAELSEAGYITHHATGSKAFTENVRKAVGRRASAQFGYFNSYADAEEGTLDVLICDEAHRIRERSWNRFTKVDQRSDSPQVEELVKVADVTVFFIDDLQVVRPGEIGSSDLISEAAARAGVELLEYELEAQFRCGGSEAFVQWVENTLELRRTPHVLWEGQEGFDFDVVDSPEELEALIRQRAEEGHSARMTAGFCWRWSNPNDDGTLISDVQIKSWERPWNAKPDSARLAPGIPKSNYWATDPEGVEQVGCIYTAQGFEFDYVGVIIGRDLVYRPGQRWEGQREHSRDSVVRRERDPERFTRLIKSAYRVLLSRGLQGCYVYFEDQPTRDFVLSRIDWAAQREAVAAEQPEDYDCDP